MAEAHMTIRLQDSEEVQVLIDNLNDRLALANTIINTIKRKTVGCPLCGKPITPLFKPEPGWKDLTVYGHKDGCLMEVWEQHQQKQ